MTLTQVMEKATTVVKGKGITLPKVTWFVDYEKPVVNYEEFISMNTLAAAAVRAPARPVPAEALPKFEEQPLDAQFMRALEQVVREVGESHRCQPRFGPGCAASGQFRYVYDGQGDCIVGKVLIKMGVPVDQIGEGEGAGQLIGSLYGGRYPQDQVNRTGQIAMTAQIENDSRHPWGSALASARAVQRALV